MKPNQPPYTFATVFSTGDHLREAFALQNNPGFETIRSGYRSWRKVEPMARQAGIEPKSAWAGLKLSRWVARRELPLDQMNGEPFCVVLTPTIADLLHRLDRAVGGGAADFENPHGLLADVESRRRASIRSLMDEAIDSARIEGAATTRVEALELLRSSRKPVSTHERMVVNNYRGMQRIKSWLGRTLSTEMLCELQDILTEGTLEDPGQAGRLRRADEPVRVVDRRTNDVIFEPPPAGTLPDRLRRLCEFANTDHDGERFLHPIMKACILHFMIGYEHPFADGNGRTARAVFFWSALRSGYSIFEFLVISDLILKGVAAYPRAYLDVENDDGDTTYFVLYKLKIIGKSISNLARYLENEREKIEQGRLLLGRSTDLNLRQRLLIQHMLAHPKVVYTAKQHASANGITPATSRSDLDELRRMKLVTTYTVGREVHYVPVSGLAERLTRHLGPRRRDRRPRA